MFVFVLGMAVGFVLTTLGLFVLVAFAVRRQRRLWHDSTSPTDTPGGESSHCTLYRGNDPVGDGDILTSSGS